MTTTMSFSKKQFSFLYLFSLKKSAGWTTIYTILLFLSYPLVTFNQCSSLLYLYKDKENKLETIFYRLNNYLVVSDFIVSFLMCVMVLVFSGVLYSYMHSKRSADFFHSMPVKREVMLSANFCSGLTSIVVPIWLNSLIVGFIFPFVFGNSVDCSKLYLLTAEKALAWTLGAFILFAITTLVSVCVSTSVENIGYTTALLLEGSVLFVIWDTCCQSVFETYSSIFYSSEDIIGNLMYYLSPVFALAKVILLAHDFTFGAWTALLLWFVLGVVALYFALKFYSKRQSELAEQWGRQTKIGFAVKLSSSIIGAYLFGMIFGALLGLDIHTIFLFGSLIGSPIVYIVIEAITNRGFNNMKKCLPYMAVTVALTFVFSLYFVFDGFGYDENIPNADEVECVNLEITSFTIPYVINNDNYAENHYFENDDLIYYDINDEIRNLEFSQPETIEIILDMHEDAVYYDPNLRSNYTGRVRVEYDKNLGKSVRNLEIRTANQKNHLALFYSDEYLEKYNPFFELKSYYLNEVSISDKLGNEIDSLSKDIFDQLIIAIQQDLKNAEIDDLFDTKNNKDVFIIDFRTKYPKEIFEEFSEHYHFTTDFYYIVREKDYNTINLLTSLGFENNLGEDLKENIFGAEFHFASHSYGDIPGIANLSGTGVFDRDNYYLFERITSDKDFVFDVLKNSSSVYNFDASQYLVTMFYSSNDINDDSIYGRDLYIDRDVLCELMVKHNNFAYAYKINRNEEEIVRDAFEKLHYPNQNDDDNYSYEVAMKEEYINWHQRDINEELKSYISMKDFCEQNCPEILEGKTSAELRCMQETPLINSENVFVYFD